MFKFIFSPKSFAGKLYSFGLHCFSKLLSATIVTSLLVASAEAAGPLRVNHRGRRLPLVGWTVALHEPVVTAIGLADDLWSGPERGFRAHLRTKQTTGVLKLVGVPAYALLRSRSAPYCPDGLAVLREYQRRFLIL